MDRSSFMDTSPSGNMKSSIKKSNRSKWMETSQNRSKKSKEKEFHQRNHSNYKKVHHLILRTEWKIIGHSTMVSLKHIWTIEVSCLDQDVILNEKSELFFFTDFSKYQKYNYMTAFKKSLKLLLPFTINIYLLSSKLH